MSTTTRRTLTGHEAIDYAEEHGLTLHKHTDPTEEARDVTPDEAREIAAEDPSLIWVDPVRTIRLNDDAYEPRQTIGGGTVRDLLPWEGATDYVTDGDRYGVRYSDGAIDWLGTSPESAFGEGVEIVSDPR